MKHSVVRTRNRILGLGYANIAKPLFFQMDPENVHDIVSRTIKYAAYVPLAKTVAKGLLGYDNDRLTQTMCGITFKNPIGLSAGFDKNGELTHILPSSGLGFMEIGSVTGEPCDGNPKPRLWRLKDQQSLVVWYGLKSDGAERVAQRLSGKKFRFPVGISIAKTNSECTVDDASAVEDYMKAAWLLQKSGAYMTVNISCPNTYGGQPFTNATRLEKLLSALDELRIQKPVFLKLSPDLDWKELDDLLDVADQHRISGYISSNLTKQRDYSKTHGVYLPQVGGMSGKLVQERSDQLIRHLYGRYGRSKVIIGSGGVFTAEDAYQKIRNGASLIQMITGIIFQGPQCISEINRGLVELLERDGFENISEAVGVDVK